MMKRGFTMIATLITVVIILILMVVLMKGEGLGGDNTIDMRKDGLGKTTMGGAILTAKDAVCQSNLSQVRQALAAARMSSTDGPPQSINEAGLPPNEYVCPVGGEAYVYDPATGQVHCPHPGHEKF
jgi:hypothetical protein